jgi:sterol desaturase/sphingolipid hydroxylase (fatty acid hydroxylase superfamily)
VIDRVDDLLRALAGTGVSFVALAVVFGMLERAFPARAQRFFRKQFTTDALFFVGQYLVWTVLATALLARLRARIADTSLFSAIDGALADSLHAWPIAVQVIVVVALGDLLVYWFHRACHSVPVLWRFHKVHHSAEHLDWLAAHREHPLDGLVTMLAVNLPAFLLGAPLAWLAPVAVVRGVWGVFIHSNIRMPLGIVGLALGDPSLHRLHHRRDVDGAGEPRTVNFANLAPYLDVLFGTHARAPTEDYALGVRGEGARGYFAHVFRP